MYILAFACTRPSKHPSFPSPICRLRDGTWIVPQDLSQWKRSLYLIALLLVLPRTTLSPLKSPTPLKFPLLRLRYQRERVEQRRLSLKPLPKLSLGVVQSLPLSHPPFHTVHLSLPRFLHRLHPPVLPRLFLHNLMLLLLRVALLFSPCLARGRPPSWIRVPPLRSRLPRLPSSKMWTWCNSCSIPRLQEVPSRHIRASKSSLPRFVCFPLALIILLSVWIVFFSFFMFSHFFFLAGWGRSFPCEHLLQ